jgi:hypothetical protein
MSVEAVPARLSALFDPLIRMTCPFPVTIAKLRKRDCFNLKTHGLRMVNQHREFYVELMVRMVRGHVDIASPPELSSGFIAHSAGQLGRHEPTIPSTLSQEEALR